MKFCMLSTFFGAHSFGGDAAFVDRLSGTLARHGHEVHVIHCRDAFEASSNGQPPRDYDPPARVHVHALKSPFSSLSPLATHQTGRPAFKTRAIQRLLRAIRPDVIHYHNISLIGGPGLLSMPAPGAVKLMTTHEHWLVCPLTVLWKLGAGICETPDCARCCLRARRPPQLWRKTSLLDRSLNDLDALICPSRSTQFEHARRGITRSTILLPYFLPDDDPDVPPVATPRHARPYVVVAGRLESIKGFQDAIEAFRRLPGVDLRIAGSGSFEPELRKRARGIENVSFEGRLDQQRLGALFRGAIAVVVPSLVYETFGYVVLEAFHEGTPVIVRNLGALPELVRESQGGLVFDTTDELASSVERLVEYPRLRAELGANGRRARREQWSEAAHLSTYFALIEDLKRTRRVRADRPHSRHRPMGDRHLSREEILPIAWSGSGESSEMSRGDI